MPYRYNEKTGEFEGAPECKKRRYRPQAPEQQTYVSSDKVMAVLFRLLLFGLLGAIISGM